MNTNRSIQTIKKTTAFFNKLKGKTLTAKGILEVAKEMKVRHNLQKFAVELGWCTKLGREYTFENITFHPNLIVQLLELSDAYNKSLKKTPKVVVPTTTTNVEEALKDAKTKHEEREKKMVELSKVVGELHSETTHLRDFIMENTNIKLIESLKAELKELSIKYNALVDENNQLKNKLVDFAMKSLDRMMHINNQTKN